MEWNKQNVKSLLLVVCGGVAFHALLQHLDAVTNAVGGLLGVLSPFLLGGAIAFVLNVPMRAVERHLYPNARRGGKLRRPLAYLVTLVCVAGVLALASWVVVPNLADAVSSAAKQIPAAAAQGRVWLEGLAAQLPAVDELLAQWDINWYQVSAKLLNMVQGWGNSLLTSGGGFVSGVVSGISSFVIGFVFSIYILMQKEKLGGQVRRCLYALAPEKAADRILYVVRLAAHTFSSFLSGQCLEACILGALFVVAMSIFRMPYALLVGVLIAITALIPVVGAFIGCGVGFLLLLITNPWQALMFVVLFLVLQQIEGNLIYPHVVGSSVGLPSIWVLVAVVLGGKLFGVAGMLLFIPLCSVLYALFRQFVCRRLEKRKISPDKLNGNR